jgi:hypothetical protein
MTIISLTINALTPNLGVEVQGLGRGFADVVVAKLLEH